MEKQIGKKILSVFLAIIMLVTILPAGNLVETQAATTGVDQKIDEILKMFPSVKFKVDKNNKIITKKDPDGVYRRVIDKASYFTADGKPCVSSGSHQLVIIVNFKK